MDYTIQILNLFKNHPNNVFSTTKIVALLCGEELEQYEKEYIKDKNHKNLKKFKRQKIKIQRRLLYHLNKLVDEDILKITKIGEKGEKYYELNLPKSNEILIRSKFAKVRITKNESEFEKNGFEKEGVLKKFKAGNMLERINSVFINLNEDKNLKEIEKILYEILKCINDALAFNNFNELVNKYDVADVKDFIEKINGFSVKFCAHTNLIINNIDAKLLSLLNALKKEDLSNIFFIFNVNHKRIISKKNLGQQIVRFLKDNNLSFFIKNNEITEVPFFIGENGIYTFSRKDWKNIPKEIQIIPCSLTTNILDFKKFYAKNKYIEEIRKKLWGICENIFKLNFLQRDFAQEIYNHLDSLNKENILLKTFALSRHFLRFKNIDILRDLLEEKDIPYFLQKIRSFIYEYTANEEIIYFSCGMPIRFRIGISNFFEENEKRIFIEHIDDIYKPEIKKIIKFYEALCENLSLNFTTQFIFSNLLEEETILRIIAMLISSYSLPFMEFQFKKESAKNLKITDFFRK